MASTISPCVLPLIPVIVGFSILKRTTLEIISFNLGFFLFFASVTILTAIFTAAINYYLLYFRITAALILVVTGILLIAMKNMFNLPTTSIFSKSNSRKGILGSFLMGFLTCLAWSPCFGPYVVAIATYSASTGDLSFSVINMTLFAGGFSLTIFIMAMLMSKIRFDFMIKHSDWIRIISGVIIASAGLYMLMGFL